MNKETIVKLWETMKNSEKLDDRIDARNILIDEEGVSLAHYVLETEYPHYKDMHDELFQESALAMIENIEKFNPEEEELGTFFMPIIRKTIVNGIKEAKTRKLVINTLFALKKQGKNPSVYDIHLETGVPMKEISDILFFKMDTSNLDDKEKENRINNAVKYFEKENIVASIYDIHLKTRLPIEDITKHLTY